MAVITLSSSAYTQVIAAGVDGEIYNKNADAVFIVTAASQPTATEEGVPIKSGDASVYNMSGSTNAVWAKSSDEPSGVFVNLAPSA